MAEQVKSKQRVADHGEVFTAEREVKAMCDLVAEECLRISSRFLEPACGEGAFLTEILTRKLSVVRENYGNVASDYELFSLQALASLYGIDILSDNAQWCREHLFSLWDSEYTNVCGEAATEEARAVARHILHRNIVCGNALTMKCVNSLQEDTEAPIVISEWVFDGAMVTRRDFRLDDLGIQGDERQGQLFDEPEPVAEFPQIDYRRLPENDE